MGHRDGESVFSKASFSANPPRVSPLELKKLEAIFRHKILRIQV
jgi:hypothetical protein